MKEQKGKKQWLLGIMLILVALGLASYGVWCLFVGTDNPKEAEKKQTQTVETLANDAGQIETEAAKAAMKLNLAMDPSVEKAVPDLEELKEAFADYLVEEGFYTDVTKATCTNVVTWDYNQDTLILSFTLNNSDQTPVDLIYEPKTSEYTFTYY